MSEPSVVELFEVTEALHPDLLPFLSTEGPFPMLKHPYVFSIPHGDAFNAIVNRQYAMKSKEIEQARAIGNWSQYLYLHERPFRRSAFSLIVDELPDVEYWKLLRNLWIDTESGHDEFDEWAELFTADRPQRQAMMTAEEEAALAEMGERFTIYRGVSDAAHLGLSWTIDEDKAAWFAERWDCPTPVVLTAEVTRSQVLAFFTSRGESEVLVDPAALSALIVEDSL